MARKQQLTWTFYLGGKRIDKLTPEQLDKMAQRIGEAMSEYYTAHLDEYSKIKEFENEKNSNQASCA